MTIDKEKLKPCPFCGGPVELETVKSRAGTLYGVVCRNTGNRGCTCAMEQVPSRTAEAAIARWNMRKPEDDLRAEISQLQEHKRGLIELRETHGFDSWSAALVEIDRLKAENERLDRLIVVNKQVSDSFMHERDTLGQAIGEAVTKVGIAAAGFPLTGPHLLMFLEDMANDSVRMLAENEVLRRDAGRYRWLRDPDHQGDPESGNPKIICGYEEHEDIMWLDGLDAAIDAGMTQEAGDGDQ